MRQHSLPMPTDELDNIPLLLIPTDERPRPPAQPPMAAPVALDAVGGSAAGAIAGAIAGPSGMAIGAVLGGIAGAVAGIAMERANRAKREYDEELDREIDLTEADIGEASPDRPEGSWRFHAETLGLGDEGSEASDVPFQKVAGTRE